jgi:hypothetical protein
MNLMDAPLFDQDQDQDNEPEHEYEDPETYTHFCEHFRINPGSRCTECTKCDLYQSEDEEAVARRAGEKAEREWRIRQGATTTSSSTSAGSASASGGAGVVRSTINDDFSAETGRVHETLRYWVRDVWREGRWKVEGQAIVDALVERVVYVVEI